MRERKEDRGTASARLEVSRPAGERERVRARVHRVKARKGVPKGGDESSLGGVQGEEGGWCTDAGEGAGGREEASHLRLHLSLRGGEKK